MNSKCTDVCIDLRELAQVGTPSGLYLIPSMLTGLNRSIIVSYILHCEECINLVAPHCVDCLHQYLHWYSSVSLRWTICIQNTGLYMPVFISPLSFIFIICSLQGFHSDINADNIILGITDYKVINDFEERTPNTLSKEGA